jgi:hypothetical protein
MGLTVLGSGEAMAWAGTVMVADHGWIDSVPSYLASQATSCSLPPERSNDRELWMTDGTPRHGDDQRHQ